MHHHPPQKIHNPPVNGVLWQTFRRFHLNTLLCHAVQDQMITWGQLFYSRSESHAHKGGSAAAGIVTFREPSFVIGVHHRKCWGRVQRRDLLWCVCRCVTGFSVGGQTSMLLLFTRDFAIKAGERDGKRLHGAHRVVEVQREDVISYSAKLHHDVVHWKRQGIVKIGRYINNELFLWYNKII